MGGNPSVQDLWNEYHSIFPSGNRNAASHRWASFILQHSSGLDVEVIKQLFRGFCAVSGSPVTPSSAKRYKYSLPRVDGGSETGFIYHCCMPCVCDTQEFIRLDTKTIETSTGPQEFIFQVIGNPCSSASFTSIYQELWADPFRPGQKSSLAFSAPDVKCEDSVLDTAVMSDNGNVIVGMVFDEPDEYQGMSFTDVASTDLAMFCEQRKSEGYNSGMGVIFAKVANITRPGVFGNFTVAETHGNATTYASGSEVSGVTQPFFSGGHAAAVTLLNLFFLFPLVASDSS